MNGWLIYITDDIFNSLKLFQKPFHKIEIIESIFFPSYKHTKRFCGVFPNVFSKVFSKFILKKTFADVLWIYVHMFKFAHRSAI